MAFIYNGITYLTLSDAANRLDLSQPYLSTLKKTRNLSDEEAVEYSIKQRDTKHRRGNSQECIVFGKHFPSISEACRYHKIPYISVRSRMSRNGETVEQAIDVLVKGKNERESYETATFPLAGLEEIHNYSIDKFNSSIKGLIKKLEARGYSLTFFSSDKNELPIIEIKRASPTFREGRCWISMGKKQTSLTVTGFYNSVKAEEKLTILDKLNTKNSLNSGIILWLSQETQTGIFEITAGRIIPHNKNYETPVMTVLKEIENVLKYCEEISAELNN